MEFPTTEWDIFEASDFETAAPRSTGSAVMELMMQLRPNGRIQDHFRVALGGSSLCQATIGFGRLLPTVDLQRVQIVYEFWAKDLTIRRNMSTSEWIDVYDGIRENRLQLTDRAGAQLSDEDRAAIVTILEKSENNLKSASFRFAVVVGPDERMRLEMQGMPGAASLLNSMPAFTG